LFDGAATLGIGLQCPALTNADIFLRESSYCFHCVLAIAILSVCHTGWSIKSGAS